MVTLLAVAVGLTGCSQTSSTPPQKIVPSVTVSDPVQKEITDYADYCGEASRERKRPVLGEKTPGAYNKRLVRG